MHQYLAIQCLQLMWTSFGQDNERSDRPDSLVAICSTDQVGTLATEIEANRVERHLAPEIQYACLHWIEHLQRSGAQLHDHGAVHRFLRWHVLHWLEALGWMRKVPEGIWAIASLELFASVSTSP
jgi:hypothetical protein